MSVDWFRGRGRQRAPWLLLLVVVAAAVWAAAQEFKIPLAWRVTASVAAVVIPLLVGEAREWFTQDDEQSLVLRQHLRGYSRRRGIPTVASIRKLSLLNVSASRGPRDPDVTGPYVRRDRDTELDELLRREDFVVLIGDSKAGKSRMAAEAVRRLFPERRWLIPESADSLNAILEVGLDLKNSVIWLDELQKFLEKNGLARLLQEISDPDGPEDVTLIGTIRELVYTDYIPHDGVESPYWPTLRQATRLRIDRLFSDAERRRAAEEFHDARLLAALNRYGLAEYLAAGPDLLERLENAMAGRPVGAAIVLAAADWSRTGLAKPIPTAVLRELARSYASSLGIPPPDPRQIAEALKWAREPVYATSSLLAQDTASQGYAVFDYVLDNLGNLGVRYQASIPESTWEAALAAAEDGDEAMQVGLAAFEQNQVDFAIRALAVAVADTETIAGPAASYNYASMLQRVGRTDEANGFYAKAADAGHVDAMNTVGSILQSSGELEAAEGYFRRSAESRSPEGAFRLGLLLTTRLPDEALTWLKVATEANQAGAALATGRILEARGDVEAAQAYYLRRADVEPEAACALGLLLRNQNEDEALRWLGKAAEAGNAEAARAAGQILQTNGARARAERYYRMAKASSQRAALPPAPTIRHRPPSMSREELDRRCDAVVEPVVSLEAVMGGYTDDELRLLTHTYRRRVREEGLEALLPEAFATVREAAHRQDGSLWDLVDIMGGAALYFGAVAEIQPDIDPIPAIILAAYLNSLTGDPVHVLSVTEAAAVALSDRAVGILESLDVAADLLSEGLTNDLRRIVYAAPITFGPMRQFAFDFLRDNMIWDADERVQRPHPTALLPEADIALLDNLKESWSITRNDGPPTKWYVEFAKIADFLVKGEHYDIDLKERRVLLAEVGISAVEDYLGAENLYDPVNAPLLNFLDLALKAKEIWLRERDYIVQDGRLRLIDAATGQIRENMYDDGLLQAVQAKEGLELSEQQQTLARIAQWAYLRGYHKVGGLAAGLGFDSDILRAIYGLSTVRLPPRWPQSRTDQLDILVGRKWDRWLGIAALVSERHEKGQPVLIEVSKADQVTKLSELLSAAGISAKSLAMRTSRQEADVLAAAGERGAVTVGTAVGQSRPNIRLGGANATADQQRAVERLGGLLVIGAARSQSRRSDDLLKGLAGRYGQPGESMFFVVHDDGLGEIMQDFSFTMMGDATGSSSTLNWAIASIQRLQAAMTRERLETYTSWGQVEEEQRESVYVARGDVIDGAQLDERIDRYLQATIEAYVEDVAPDKSRRQWDLPALREAMTVLISPAHPLPALSAGNAKPALTARTEASAGGSRIRPWARRGPQLSRADVLAMAMTSARFAWQARIDELGRDTWFELERRVLLTVIDREWCDHLVNLDGLYEGAALGMLRGRNALSHYQSEAFDVFERMQTKIREETVGYLMNIEVQVESEPEPVLDFSQLFVQGSTREPVAGVVSINASSPEPEEAPPTEVASAETAPAATPSDEQEAR